MNTEPLRVVHIADTRILSEPGAELYGVDTLAALVDLLATMRRDGELPDYIIATGDLSQDGSAASYRRLRSLLESVGAPRLELYLFRGFSFSKHNTCETAWP